MQHSHSRHQKTSNLLRINLKGKIMFTNARSLEEAMYINLLYNFLGHPKNLVLCNFFKPLMVQTKRFTWLLEFIKLYKQNQLQIFFFFIIYQTIHWKFSFLEKVVFPHSTFKILSCMAYMISVSLIRCKNEALKNCNSKATLTFK